MDINAATKQELVDYAREELGLKIDTSKSKEEVRQLVATQIGVDVSADAQADPGVIISKQESILRRAPKVRIRIFENDQYPRHIPVGVNGVIYLIKPGAEVEVPKPVADVLRNARKTTFRQIEEGGRIRTVSTTGQSYPFEVLA